MPGLFPLELRGVGSVDIESLSSYIHRLARVHGVTIFQLLRHVYESYAEDFKSFRQEPPVFQSRGDLAIYVRPNNTTIETVRILEHVTGNQFLRSSTFLILLKALDRSSGVYSSYLRWCPACMGEFEAQDDEGYFKLIWQLKAIVHCPIHGALLLDKCPNCGNHQGTFRIRSPSVRCQKCGKSLSEGINNGNLSNSWVVEAPDLTELVDLISRNSDLEFPEDGVRKVVSHLFDRAWHNQEEKELWEIIPRDECISIDTGHKPITLTIARRIAYRLGIKLTDLLSGTIDMFGPQLDPSWSNSLPLEIKPKKRRKLHNREQLHESIVKILDEAKAHNPPPLRVVAEKIGVSTDCIRYQFPAVAQKIVEKHKHWREAEQVRKRRQARAEAFRYFTDKSSGGIGRSRKSAYKKIREETGLPKFLLKSEINEVYNMLYKGD